MTERTAGDPATAVEADCGRCVTVNDQPHLLLCGWYQPGTGFTRVLMALLPYLRQSYRITWLGVGYRGIPIDLAENIRVLPTNLRGGDMMGAYAARLHWRDWAPDVVLALNDPWYLEHYARELDEFSATVPLVGYLPLDGAITDPGVLRSLTGFHTLVTYTEWAATQLRQALATLRIPSHVHVAGHGVERQRFHPLNPGAASDPRERMSRAQALFGLADPAWVVLNASRPDPRKRLDLTLAAFAEFAASRPPEVRLCLHQALAHERFVAPLREQVQALGLDERLLWFPPRPGPLDDAALNDLYNACAVGLNTAQGEGFGLVSFEHAATGAPQVLPAHPALAELWRDCAEAVTPVRPVMTPHSPLQMGEVEPAGIARALAALHDDPDYYFERSQRVLARCGASDLDWQSVATRLLELLAAARSG